MKNHTERTERNILVPVDFSVYSHQIARIAGALGATHKARVTMLYVIDGSKFLFPENKLTPELLPELVSMFEANLEKEAQTLVDTFDVSVKTKVVCGCLVDEILQFAKSNPVDMIVSGIADHLTDPQAASASTIVRLASLTSRPVWGLIYDRPESSISSKVSLIRAKIRLSQPIREVKIRRVRPPVELVAVKLPGVARDTFRIDN